MTTLETTQPFEQSVDVLQQDEEDCSQRFFTPSKAATAVEPSDTYLLETFHQYPHGDLRPTFYNPFEIKHRRRTSRVQLKILETSFSENAKPSATIRRILAQKLDMTPRGVQIWFQNRRAKAKLLRRKSTVQQQRHQQEEEQSNNEKQQQSSSEDENEEDGDYSSDCSRFMGNQQALTEIEEASVNTTDLNQSSVLFSQFFANVHNTQDFLPTDATAYDKTISLPNQHIEWQQQQQKNSTLIDNVRTVVTAAAAAAVANISTPSAPPYEPNMLSLGSSPSWLSHGNNLVGDMLHQQQQYLLRRQSCPVAPKNNNTMAVTDNMNYSHQQQQCAYLSPSSWSQSMMSQQTQNNRLANSRSSSPMLVFNNVKRHFSYDSNSLSANTSMDYYPMQEIHHLGYATQQQHQQFTPPLTASCSASTVAGSPISLDNLYNDPVAVPLNNSGGYYSNNSRISSPLSTSTLVTDMMPNFV